MRRFGCGVFGVAMLVAACSSSATSSLPSAPVQGTASTAMPSSSALPSPSPSTFFTPSALAQASPSGVEGTCDQYTVQRGDTLARVAQSHGTTVAALIAANPEQPLPAGMTIGQAICLTPRTGGWVPTPRPSIAPTSEPSSPASNLAFDWNRLVSEIGSGAWVQEYPNVSPATVYARYKTAVAKYPALAKVLGSGVQLGVGNLGYNAAQVRNLSTLQLCFGIYLQAQPSVQFEAMQAACPWVISRLVWYVNRTGNRGALPLLDGTIGWVAHSSLFGSDPSGEGTRWVAFSLNGFSQYLDGTCNASGVWICP